MNIELQCECLKLIKKYKSLKMAKYKQEYRNRIYLLMKVDILIWIKAIMKKWNRFEEEGELLSLSWDIYIFCLDHYIPEKLTPVPKFFFEYTRYFLLMYYAKQQSIRVPLEELQEVLELIEEPENIAFGMLLRLYEFREVIPDDCKIVWDDAYLSLSNSGRNRERFKSKGVGMSDACYRRMKHSFEAIITLLLKV